MEKLLSLILFSQLTFALTPEQQATLDQLIQTRKAAIPQKSKIHELSAKIQQMENRMTPLVFTFNRVGPLIEEQSGHLDRLAEFLKDPAAIATANPYSNRTWADRNRFEMKAICCVIRKNPKVAKIVQDNLAAGNPPLSEAEYASVTSRARTVHNRSEGEDMPTLPSRPRPRGFQTGLSSGVISGLPTPSSSENSDAKAAPAAGANNTPPPGASQQTAPLPVTPPPNAPPPTALPVQTAPPPTALPPQGAPPSGSNAPPPGTSL